MKYRSYLLSVLVIIMAFNYVDRWALGLVLQEIKADLSLSDTQLGLLTGIAFALFYSVMGIPIARWADRGNRVTIISLTTAVWSVSVALCGMAASFASLLLIRVGVAIGEAGCLPPAHSLLSDYFTRAERPRAFARYWLATPLSVVIGFFLAGWLNQFLGWRMMFVWLGIPGLALALLARLTLREPRVTAAVSQASVAEGPGLKEVCATLWSNATFRSLLLCNSVSAFFNFGITQWKPAFFIRSFGLSTGELGTWFALIYGVGGLLGTYAGGELASRFAARNERLQLRAVALVWSAFSVLSLGVYMSSTHHLAFALTGLIAVGSAMINGPLFATIQTLVPPRMRAMSISITFLFANLIGMGLGPLAAGALSDGLRPLFGEQSLRYALMTLCPGYVWAGWYVWKASNTVTQDLRAARLATADAAGDT